MCLQGLQLLFTRNSQGRSLSSRNTCLIEVPNPKQLREGVLDCAVCARKGDWYLPQQHGMRPVTQELHHMHMVLVLH